MKKLTKKETEILFKEEILPFVDKKDKPALRQAWNDYTDFLCRNGEITMRQYETWTQPRFISGESK